MYSKIKAALTAAGIPCYDPGTQGGKCQAPYAVCHDMGTTPMAGTKGMLGKQLYEIICFVPYQKQAMLHDLVTSVKAALAPITPLKWTGEQAPTGIESTYEAASMSLLYQVPKRLQ